MEPILKHLKELIGGALVAAFLGVLSLFYAQYIHQQDVCLKIREQEVGEAKDFKKNFDDLINQRLFRTRRLIWAHGGQDKQLEKEAIKSYRQKVYEWNEYAPKNYAQLEGYFGSTERVFVENKLASKMRHISVELRRSKIDKPTLERELNEAVRLASQFESRIQARINARNIGVLPLPQDRKRSWWDLSGKC